MSFQKINYLPKKYFVIRSYFSRISAADGAVSISQNDTEEERNSELKKAPLKTWG